MTTECPYPLSFPGAGLAAAAKTLQGGGGTVTRDVTRDVTRELDGEASRLFENASNMQGASNIGAGGGSPANGSKGVSNVNGSNVNGCNVNGAKGVSNTGASRAFGNHARDSERCRPIHRL